MEPLGTGAIRTLTVSLPNIFLGPILLHASRSRHQLFHRAFRIQGCFPGRPIMIRFNKIICDQNYHVWDNIFITGHNHFLLGEPTMLPQGMVIYLNPQVDEKSC